MSKGFFSSLKGPLIVYGILNIAAIVVFAINWNVTSKLLSHAMFGWQSLFFFAMLCGLIYGLHRWSHSLDGNFSRREAFVTMGLVFVPYMLLYSIFMAVTTGLSDYCTINTYVQKVINIKEYYTERSEERCTGTGDNRSCTTYYYCDQYHPEAWYIRTGDGTTISISALNYVSAGARFGTDEVLVANSQLGQCSGDGREFHITWSGTPQTRIPAAYEQLYINYVRAIEMKKGARKDWAYGPGDYPVLQSTPYGQIGIQRVLGDNPPSEAWASAFTAKMSDELTWLGAKRQCNVLLYFTKQPKGVVQELKDKWLQGKKNDIVLFIGGSPERVDWAEVWCWGKTQSFETRLRNRLTASDCPIANPTAFADMIVQHIDDPNFGFERKSMEEYRHLLSQVHLSWLSWLLLSVFIFLIILFPVIYFFRSRYSRLDERSDDNLPVYTSYQAATELRTVEQNTAAAAQQKEEPEEEEDPVYTDNPIRGHIPRPEDDIRQMEIPFLNDNDLPEQAPDDFKNLPFDDNQPKKD